MTNILELNIEQCNAGSNITVKAYLKELLKQLWIKTENFDAKRPLGYSGWEYDLYMPLVAAGILEGKFDEDGNFDESSGVDEEKARQLILEAIESL